MVGLCIKHQHENYGGMLQAFATVCFFENRHVDYELIRYTRKKKPLETIKDIPRLLNVVWLNSRYEGLQRKLSLKIHPEYARNNAVRMKAFAEFKDWAFSNYSEHYKGYEALCEGGKKYSAVVTGSDQLWSPAGLPSNYYNLMFVPDRTLKISIASSFGVKEIPWYQRMRTKKFLERMDYISMREFRGSEIVRELTGKEVPTILDPVFFLSREEWLDRIPQETVVKEPYIFAYFLGANRAHRTSVIQFAKEKGLKIVALRHMDQYVKEDESFGDYAPYDVDPRMFLNLLRNAEYVCTDSFHGTAFSIINQKQFIVFDRYKDNSGFSKNSRIDTLCREFDLGSRRYYAGAQLCDITKENIDYELVEAKLEQQIMITNDYLNSVISRIIRQLQ